MRECLKKLKNITNQFLIKGSDPIVAISGGIDSITLSTFISKEIKKRLNVAHAVSPAVSVEATNRVKDLSKRYNWKLHILNAGEMRDKNYTSNPINRCFYCKTNLYYSISSTLNGQILSGANLDDLNDFRPGLKAAENSSVRHPFIESQMGKKEIRALANQLGLKEISKLPASPCLSSRIQTGIYITSDLLKKIDRVERKIKNMVPEADVRCRWLNKGITIEFNEPSLEKINDKYKTQIINFTEEIFKISKNLITMKKYKMGSAFIEKQRV